MKTFLKTKIEIESWLNRMEIDNYTLSKSSEYGYVVDVKGSVDISGKNLTSIPVKFHQVSEDFNCCHNALTSLTGSPESVGYHFMCDNNQINTLRHSPRHIKGIFSCSRNLLQQLQYCPEIVEANFYFYSNKIETLEHFPQNVKGEVFCFNNPLLGDAQALTDFSQLYQLHLDDLIKKEKHTLSQDVSFSDHSFEIKKYKI